MCDADADSELSLDEECVGLPDAELNELGLADDEDEGLCVPLLDISAVLDSVCVTDDDTETDGLGVSDVDDDDEVDTVTEDEAYPEGDEELETDGVCELVAE